MAGVCLMDPTLASVLVLGLASLVVADTDVTISTECPESDTGRTVSLAHETDCTKYYACSGGKKYLKECPVMDADGNRLHFNPDLQVCDWPQNVHCNLPKPRDEVTPIVGILGECPEIDPVNRTIHLAHETDCTTFYKCRRGKKLLMDCPTFDDKGNKLYFNETLQLCDWPWNVDCEQPKPRIAYGLDGEIPSECPKVDSIHYTVHLAHENDCTKFYTCSHGQKVLSICPVANSKGDRLHFSPVKQVCDWPRRAKCKLPGPGSEKQCRGTCPINDDGFIATLPHVSDCTKYCRCRHGKPYLLDCPQGHHFNESAGSCVPASSPNCDADSSPLLLTASLTIPSSIVSSSTNPSCQGTCPNDYNRTYIATLPHKEDYTKYCFCQDGYSDIMDCPLRLNFNVVSGICD